MQNLLYHFHFKYVCRACKWTPQNGENSVLCFSCMFDFSEKLVIKHSLLGWKNNPFWHHKKAPSRVEAAPWPGDGSASDKPKVQKKAAGLAGSWYQASSSFCSIKLIYRSVFNQLWKCMILDVKCKGKCSLLGKDKNGMKSNDPNQTWGAFFF